LTDPATGESYVRGILLAYAKPDATEEAVQQAVAAIGGRIVGTISQVRLYQIQVSASNADALRQLAETLKTHPAIENAFLDTMINAPVVEEGEPIVEWETKKRNRLLPNDPIWQNDWSDEPKGSNWYLEMINAPAAWNITRGSREHSKIAIIDSGFDTQHEDLRDNISSFSQLFGPPNVSDWQKHGTAVAGLVAAVGDNGKGITGVCWFASLKLFGLGLVLSEGSKRLVLRSLYLGAIILAVDSGARVINLSLGARPKDEEKRLLEEAFFRPAFRYAKSRDVLFVMAAGNDNAEATNYVPQSFAADPEFMWNVLVVGACNINGKRAGYSNWGEIVDIAAPGGGRWYLGIPIGNPMFILMPGSRYGEDRFIIFAFSAGTSCAAPLVTGTAGLLLAVNPNLSARQLKDFLIRGAREGGRFYEDKGFRVYILNAAQSVNLASGSRHAIPSLTADQVVFATVPAVVTFDARASVLTPEVAAIRLDFGDGTPPVDIDKNNFVSNAVVRHTYTDSGKYVARLTFYRDRDLKQVLASTTLTIFVGQSSVNLIIR
jgi:subtilisin family serine protease